MITVVVGKEIEKLKGEFESVINGMNMVGEIPYNIYSELYDVATDCIQKAYELGKAELEKELEQVKKVQVVEHFEAYGQCRDSRRIASLEKENEELKEENKKWKDEWQEQVQKANDEGYARTLQTIQLKEAKDLIRNLLRVTYGEGWNYSLDVKVKAEDFLKDCNNE